MSEYCKNCFELTEKLDKKEHECEELKKQLETSEKWRIKAESLNEKLDLKNTRYRKALEEIEQEITALHYITIPFHRGITHELADIVQEYKNKILDIINKAKGEGSEYSNIINLKNTGGNNAR